MPERVHDELERLRGRIEQLEEALGKLCAAVDAFRHTPARATGVNPHYVALSRIHDEVAALPPTPQASPPTEGTTP